jgi:LPS export ABC transporter protein LptC
MIKTNKIRQLLALFVVLASISLAAVIVLKVYRSKGQAELLRKLPQNIDVSLQKVHFTETRNGIKKWDLVADKADYDKSREVTHLTGIRLVVAGDRATGDVTVTAERAEYYNTVKDIGLVGRVEAKSASGMEFTADSMTYVAARSLLRTPGRVRFSDGTITVEGVGMEFTPATKNVRILKDVTARTLSGIGR